MPPLAVKVKEKKKIAPSTPAASTTIAESRGNAKFTAQENQQDEGAVSSISNAFDEVLTSMQPFPASAPAAALALSASNPQPIVPQNGMPPFSLQPSPAPALSEQLPNPIPAASNPIPATASNPIPTAQAAAPPVEGVRDTTKIYNRILEIYQEHNPKKVSTIPKLLEDYKGREEVLLEKMEQKYLKSSSVVPASSTSTSAPSNSLFSPLQGTSNTPIPSLLQSTPNNVTAGTPTPFTTGGTNAPVSSLFGSGSKSGELPLPTLGKTPSPGLLSAATTGASLNLTSNQNQQQQPASLFSPATAQTSVFRARAASGSSPSTIVPGASLFGGGPSTASIQQSTPFSVASANPPLGSATSTGSLSQQELWQRVNAIYLKHNPAKVSEIPYILEKYKGNELQLLANLEKKYNISSNTGSTSSSISSGASPFGSAQQMSGSLFGNMGAQSNSSGNNLFGQQQQSLFGSPPGGFPQQQQQQQQQPSFGTGAGMGGTPTALFSGLRNTNPAAGATSSLFGGAGATLNSTVSPSGGSLFGRQNTGNPTAFGSGFGTTNNTLQMWR